MTASVCDLLARPIADPDASQQSGALIQVLSKSGAIAAVTAALPSLSRTAMGPPLTLIWRLLSTHPPLLQQFVESGGLAAPLMSLVLAPSNPAPLLSDALLIVSQVARVSREHYEAIAKGRVHAHLGALLRHPDAGVRAKCCNLIGNMCRHSPYFYGAFEKDGLVDALVDLCHDPDPTARRVERFQMPVNPAWTS